MGDNPEKTCERCGGKFIPTIHNKWQRFCKTCSPIQTKERKKKEYEARTTIKTTIYLSPKEKKFLQTHGINLSKLVRETIKKYQKALEPL